MAELIANTHVPGHGWWGPAHGRADPPTEVAELITNPACWSEPPEPVADLADPATIDDLSGEEGPASPMVSTGAAGAGDDGGDLRISPEPAPNTSTVDLDALDKAGLLALADERGVDVDRRWGEPRLRRVLRDAGVG